MKLSIGNNV